MLRYWWTLLLWFLGYYPRWMNDASLFFNYSYVGQDVGSMLFDRHLGQAVGYEEKLSFLVELESELIKRGYRATPMFFFTYYFPEDGFIIALRNEGEKPIYFAKEWKEWSKDQDVFGNFLQRAFESDEVLIETTEEQENIFAYELKLIRDVSLQFQLLPVQ